MNTFNLPSVLESSAVIPAVKNDEQLAAAIKSSSKIVFVLYGNVMSITKIVKTIIDSGKLAFVHIDFIDGLSPREAAVEFVLKVSRASGIISTKASLIKHAKAIGALAVQRFFLLDSIAFNSIPKQLQSCNADLIEILPGVVPKLIAALVQQTSIPLVAGGLISEKSDVMAALKAGASAVSTSKQDLWLDKK